MIKINNNTVKKIYLGQYEKCVLRDKKLKYCKVKYSVSIFLKLFTDVALLT